MFTQELADAKNIARKAGDKILQFYNDIDLEIKYKEGESPVTKADLASEEIILNFLAKYDYGILSEETNKDNNRLSKELVWIIDPLDGTKDFIAKTGDFSIMIGLALKGQAVLGVVYQPTVDKMYYAIRGQGSFLEENNKQKKLQVSKRSKTEEIILFVSRHHRLPAETELAHEQGIRNFIQKGSAGLKLGLIAEGQGDLYINTSNRTGEWDICAGSIILEEAGGKITDLSGNGIEYNKQIPINKNGFLASNNIKHEITLKHLSEIIKK